MIEKGREHGVQVAALAATMERLDAWAKP